MADLADRLALRAGGEGFERRITGLPIHAADPDFHELVVFEGARRFGDHPVGEAGIADEDDRLQGMPEAAQMLALLFRSVVTRPL